MNTNKGVAGGFAVICDARAGHGLGVEVLALVDRAKCRSLWWTSDNPGIAIRYAKESAAKFAAGRLRMNRARVVPFAQAQIALLDQAEEIDHRTALAESDEGWDSHKAWTGASA